MPATAEKKTTKPARDAAGPDLLCNREGLLAGFAMVTGIVPARSPKPILQQVKLVADPDDGTVLMATDLEVGIRYRVLGVKVNSPGAMILPTQKVLSILRLASDEELAVELGDAELSVRGLHSWFKLATEDPTLFPDVPDFTAAGYHLVAAADLKRLIRRTIFATDPESTRYALGGCLVELTPESIALVATDGRRLARMAAPAEIEAGGAQWQGRPVIPLKALKLIDRNLDDDDPPVHLALTKTAAFVRTERATIYSRLVEGRFPRYEEIFPKGAATKVALEAGPLLSVVTQAAIVTSTESRGVDFKFADGMLSLSSTTADVGSSEASLPILYEGKPVALTFDARYLVDVLKALDPTTVLTAEIIDGKSPCVFRTEDSYAAVIMPLTQD